MPADIIKSAIRFWTCAHRNLTVLHSSTQRERPASSTMLARFAAAASRVSVSCRTAAAASLANTRAFGDAAGGDKKTALYDVHVKSGGKLVPFGGYLLPVQYAGLVSASHNHTRKSASLFDVSHMGQVRIVGDDRVAFMESLCVMDIAGGKPNLAKLSVLTNGKGGVIDDCMITPRADAVYIVLNAGCKDKDMAHIKAQAQAWNKAKPSANPVKLEYFEDRALVALQGPRAAEVLKGLLEPGSIDLPQFAFMSSVASVRVGGVDCAVTRCGYTGEDGFEIGCSNADAEKLWTSLAKVEGVLPAGLAARDSLRLEAGLCLYGHELNEDITPIEAGLAWTISPRRKREGGFLGSSVILEQLKSGPAKKLVGLEVLAGPPARADAKVLDAAGADAGIVTSGGPAPSLDMRKIAMAYVKTAAAEPGTAVQVEVRGKANAAKVVKLPFIETRYYRVPKPAAK